LASLAIASENGHADVVGLLIDDGKLDVNAAPQVSGLSR
jgi:hypothetical protein